MAKGRNPDGKRFLCSEIIEPSFVSDSLNNIKKEFKVETDAANSNDSISIQLAPDEDLVTIVAAGPYMSNGSILIDQLELLIDVVKAKNAHVLILLGPFLDQNNDLVIGGNIQLTYEELLQSIFDKISEELRNTKVQVFIQPSLKDVTQEPIYPVNPYFASHQFMKQNENFHFLPEPSMIKINDIVFAISSTDVIKDLTMMSISKTASSDKITRNFSHILRQRSFYPIYPPPENVCIDFEGWQNHARIKKMPRIFITASDMANFNKEVNKCFCLNPGKLVKGTSNGTYAKIIVSNKPIIYANKSALEINQSINTSNITVNKSILDEYQNMAPAIVEPKPEPTSVSNTQVNTETNYVGISFHKM